MFAGNDAEIPRNSSAVGKRGTGFTMKPDIEFPKAKTVVEAKDPDLSQHTSKQDAVYLDTHVQSGTVVVRQVTEDSGAEDMAVFDWPGAHTGIGTGGTDIPTKEYIKSAEGKFCKTLFHPTFTTTVNTGVSSTLTWPNRKVTVSLVAMVRVLGGNVTGEVSCATCYGHVDATTVGGVEVVANLSVSVGPTNTQVSLIVEDFIQVRSFPDKWCSGPATGEGSGVSASEEHEYVAQRGVYTHRESRGHGLIVDVHYTIVLDLEVESFIWVTVDVAWELGTDIDRTHTNVYGMGMQSNDVREISVTKKVSGEEWVKKATTSLIKLTIGYTSGVVGVVEVTVLTKVSMEGATLFITGSLELDLESDSDHILSAVWEVDADSVSLNLSGPGGYNVRSVPKKALQYGGKIDCYHWYGCGDSCWSWCGFSSGCFDQWLASYSAS